MQQRFLSKSYSLINERKRKRERERERERERGREVEREGAWNIAQQIFIGSVKFYN